MFRESESEEFSVNWRDDLSAIASNSWPWSGEYVIAAFHIAVCADESGIHDSAEVCILAGYIGSIMRWSEFHDRWERVLAKFDVRDFHSKDFFAVNAEGAHVGKYRGWSEPEQKFSYGDWSDEKCEDFLNLLLAAVSESSVHPIGAYVPTSAFWAMSYGERKFLTGGKFDAQRNKWLTSGAPTKPYFLVYDHCLVEATQKTKPHLKTLFIFDQQNQFESRAIQQFAESAISLNQDPERLGNRFGGVIFEDRVKISGLQVADLYTHCWYRYVTKPDDLGHRYRALDKLTDKAPGMKFYTEDHLRGLFRHLPDTVARTIREWAEPE